jgi:hypothetical protein
MLSFEIMGLLGLGILWINTLIVVGAALTPLGELLARARRQLRHGRIVKGADNGVFATHVIEQVGRKASDDGARQAILFHDRAYRSDLAGGVLEIDGEELDVASERHAEVWVSIADKREQAASPAADFDEAYRASQRAKGYARDVCSLLSEGQSVWFAAAAADVPVLVASFDPRAWLRARILMVLAFQFAMVAISALVTWLCLFPPVFGTVSTAGGVLGLLHFLLIMQPLGVTVREAALLPNDAILRGSWVKAGSEGSGISADLGQQAI